MSASSSQNPNKSIPKQNAFPRAGVQARGSGVQRYKEAKGKEEETTKARAKVKEEILKQENEKFWMMLDGSTSRSKPGKGKVKGERGFSKEEGDGIKRIVNLLDGFTFEEDATDNRSQGKQKNTVYDQKDSKGKNKNDDKGKGKAGPNEHYGDAEDDDVAQPAYDWQKVWKDAIWRESLVTSLDVLLAPSQTTEQSGETSLQASPPAPRASSFSRSRIALDSSPASPPPISSTQARPIPPRALSSIDRSHTLLTPSTLDEHEKVLFTPEDSDEEDIEDIALVEDPIDDYLDVPLSSSKSDEDEDEDEDDDWVKIEEAEAEEEWTLIEGADVEDDWDMIPELDVGLKAAKKKSHAQQIREWFEGEKEKREREEKKMREEMERREAEEEGGVGEVEGR
jgi:hypothetical protein